MQSCRGASGGQHERPALAGWEAAPADRMAELGPQGEGGIRQAKEEEALGTCPEHKEKYKTTDQEPGQEGGRLGKVRIEVIRGRVTEFEMSSLGAQTFPVHCLSPNTR